MRMSKEKYAMLTGLAVLSFAYILATETLDRWKETAQLYSALQGKRGELLTPDQLRAKKTSLMAEDKALTSILSKGMSTYAQNHSGVFEYLNSNAKENGILFESIIPKEAVANGQMKEFAFKVDFDATYHQLGKFINAIETGTVPVSIVQLDMAPDPGRLTKLRVSAEGKAYMFSAAGHEN